MKIILFNKNRNFTIHVDLPAVPQIGHKINIHSLLTVKNAGHITESVWQEMQHKTWVISDAEWKKLDDEHVPHLEFSEAGAAITSDSNVTVLGNIATNLEAESVKYKTDDPGNENKLLEAAQSIRKAIHKLVS